MRYVERALGAALKKAAAGFPSVVLTGPRRSGKTTLLRRLFPNADYVLLEDPDVRERAQSDPRGLLDAVRPPVIVDEIQNAPHLLDYVRARIDAAPRRMGQWLFTGSQEAPLMKGVTESMAGRAAILNLLPFSVAETPKATPLAGGYPEALARPSTRELWFSSYIQTYLERDIRNLADVRDLGAFRRFLGLVASRHGQALNRSDLAAPLGVSVPTIGHWLSLLETTGQIVLAQPYFENLGKRLVKTPKLYLVDSGMACHLLGIRGQPELERSPFLGAIFEGFVASELLKAQANAGRERRLFYFRDHQGLEVDFVVPVRGGGWWLIEAKAMRTPVPAMARPLQALRRAFPLARRSAIVHRKAKGAPNWSALGPDVAAIDAEALVREYAAAL